MKIHMGVVLPPSQKFCVYTYGNGYFLVTQKSSLKDTFCLHNPPLVFHATAFMKNELFRSAKIDKKMDKKLLILRITQSILRL